MQHTDTTEKIALIPRVRYSDPREVEIHLDLPLIWCYGKEGWNGKSENENRVMPFRNIEKFMKEITKITKVPKQVDASHYWVSGYIAIKFYMKTAKDRNKMKKVVQQALENSGGFMTWGEWLKEHNKPKMQIWGFQGTGSAISGGLLNSSSVVPFY